MFYLSFIVCLERCYHLTSSNESPHHTDLLVLWMIGGKVVVHVGGLTIYSRHDTSIIFMGEKAIQKRHTSINLLLMSHKLDACSFNWLVHVILYGEVWMIICSRFSMYRLKTMGDTDLLLATSNISWLYFPPTLKHVVESTNLSRVIISDTSKWVLFFRVLSCINRSLMTSQALSTDVLVNNQTTSKVTTILSWFQGDIWHIVS